MVPKVVVIQSAEVPLYWTHMHNKITKVAKEQPALIARSYATLVYSHCSQIVASTNHVFSEIEAALK